MDEHPEALYWKSKEMIRNSFCDLLSQPGREEDLQLFLTENNQILARAFIRFVGFIIPKFRFGDEFVSDFLIGDWGQGWSFTLIELEIKEAKEFNKDGTPARRLSQAMKQLSEWTQWIKNHRAYFVEKVQPYMDNLSSKLERDKGQLCRIAPFVRYAGDFRIKHVAILGRRDENFTDVQKRRAALYNFTGDNIEIYTYDFLADILSLPDDREFLGY